MTDKQLEAWTKARETYSVVGLYPGITSCRLAKRLGMKSETSESRLMQAESQGFLISQVDGGLFQWKVTAVAYRPGKAGNRGRLGG